MSLDSTARPSDANANFKLDAKEFVGAILAYPVDLQFTLYNLQGHMAIRHSCKRRGKVPAELAFDHEFALAKSLAKGCCESRGSTP